MWFECTELSFCIVPKGAHCFIIFYLTMGDMWVLAALRGARKSTAPPTNSYLPGFGDYQRIGPLVDLQERYLHQLSHVEGGVRYNTIFILSPTFCYDVNRSAWNMHTWCL
jgi:hypothetical protein